MTFWYFGFCLIFINPVGISLKNMLKIGRTKIKVRAWTLLITCADPKTFGRGDPTFFAFLCCFNEGREDSNTTMSVSSSACQLSVSLINR